ncbi:MAG: signal peptidase I, partial [Defluviitaleaceae bacterium]|nr:signal peptidase I [Defluviitaleaceae bacterium]
TAVMVVIILFLLLQLTSVASSNGWSVFGLKAFVVETGSMSPAFGAGSYIVVKDTRPENVKVGDAITFQVSDNTILTHRVVGISQRDGLYSYATRGDANNVDDNLTPGATSQNLIGVVVFSVNHLGNVVEFLHRTPVLIGLFVILIALIAVPEIARAARKKNKGGKDGGGGV